MLESASIQTAGSPESGPTELGGGQHGGGGVVNRQVIAVAMFLGSAVFREHFFHQIGIDVARVKGSGVKQLRGQKTLRVRFDRGADLILDSGAIRLGEFTFDDGFDF